MEITPELITETALQILREHGRGQYGARWWVYEFIAMNSTPPADKAVWKQVYRRIMDLERVVAGRTIGRRRRDV